MRITFLVCITIVILTAGCEQKPKYSFALTNDSSNSGNHSMANEEDKSWSQTFRDKLTEDCISKVSETITAKEATKYCNCLTEKLEAKYPQEDGAQTNLSQADIEILKPDCLVLTSVKDDEPATNKQGWSPEEQSGWMDNCMPGAGKTLGRSEARAYCDCMMKKLMKEYPDPKHIGSVSESRLNALASECLEK